LEVQSQYQKKTGKNQTKTGKDWTAVLVFEILKSKTAKRPVFVNQFRLVWTGILYPSITPLNIAQGHVNWLKTDQDIPNFVKSSYKLI